MRAEVISFKKFGYDPFIGFLKAYAIICVIIAHNLPSFLWDYCLFRVWADMQVPMFILIQAFHAYKKGEKPKIKWNPFLKRIIIPFFIIQGLILSVKLIVGGGNFHDLINKFFINGGFGPGSYYFWIYIQIAIILVLIWSFVKKLSRIQLTWAFLSLSIGCEVLFSLIQLPDSIYRLLAVRYLFLIPLSLIWIETGVVLTFKNVALSIISIGAVIFFSFSKMDLEPLFYNTGWATHRWICYFYLPILLTYLLWLLFKWLNKYQLLSSIIQQIANSSYEIYLIQMLVFVLVPASRLNFIQSAYVRISIWILLTFTLSITGGLLFNRFEQRYLEKKK